MGTIGYLIIFALLVVAAGYLLINMLLQVRAKKQLVRMLVAHHKEILAAFNNDIKNKKAKGLSGEDEIDYEILLKVLREEIDNLKDNKLKMIMRKTLNRKNYHNQKNYAYSILADPEAATAL